MIKGNVFVSGASRGIGKNIATLFSNNGFKVIGTSRNEFSIADCNDNFIPLKLDITSRENINDCFNYLKDKNLLPNILINNAGITADQIFMRMKDEDWDNVIETNLTGTFNLSKIFIKNMIKNKNGRIINISSVSGLMGNPGQVNYASSKAALSGFTKSLAKEVGSRNITVNSVAPGFIDTDMFRSGPEDIQKQLVEGVYLNQRVGLPVEVAKVCLFLASDNSSYVNGENIRIDGFAHI